MKQKTKIFLIVGITVFILLSILVYVVFSTDTNHDISNNPNECWEKNELGEIIICGSENMGITEQDILDSISKIKANHCLVGVIVVASSIR